MQKFFKHRIASCLAMTVLLATNCCSANPGNTWYAGLALGGNSWQNSKTSSVKMTSGDSSGKTLPLRSQSDAQFAFAGGFVFGAAQESQQLFLAEQIELLYQTVDNQIDKKANDTATFINHVEETQAPTVVIAFLPGIVLNRNWVVYGKLGYAVSQFESNGINAGIFGPNGDQVQLISGLQVGIGLQRHFPKRWTLRAEYDYTNYGSFSLTGKNDAGFPGGAGGIVKTNYTINTNALMLNAIYSF